MRVRTPPPGRSPCSRPRLRCACPAGKLHSAPAPLRTPFAAQAEQQFPCRPEDARGRLRALETRGHSRVCLRREFWRCGHTVYMTVYVRSEDFGSVDIQFTGLCMSVAGISASRTYREQGCVCPRREYWPHGHTEAQCHDISSLRLWATQSSK